jgi:hypothetical protein
MRAALLVLAVLGLLAPAVPASAAPTGFDQNPILVVRFDTNTIVGQAIDTQVVVHEGGAVEIVDVLEGGPAQTSRGVVSREVFVELQRSMQAGRIAIERGNCGTPAPDGPVEFHMTWYGRDGGRFNSFRVGANPTGCPDTLQRIVRAFFEVLLDVQTSSETQRFPRDPG